MAVETPSDRDFACFFCADGKTKAVEALCPTCNESINVGRHILGLKVGPYKLLEYINRGFYGATFKAANAIGSPVAIKVVPQKLYSKYEKSFPEEIAKYSKLCPHPNIAELRDGGSSDLCIDGKSIPIFFVVMEWIEGESLTDFLKTKSPSANVIYGAILDIASALARFEKENLWHNDLNTDNILVKTLTPEEIQTRRSESPYILKIVDTGSAVFREAFRHRPLDDLMFLGQHMDALLTAGHRTETSMPLEDQFFLANLPKVVGGLLEENPSRRISTAQEVIVAVSKLYNERYLLFQKTEARLHTPFEYLNANDFPSESLVNSLFSDRFPWIKSTIVPAAQSMLITGPRGSGKTMILRSMRLKTRLNPLSEDEGPTEILARLNDDPFSAFFISARLEIGNHAPLTKLPQWLESEEATLYYFYLLYLYEVCDTLNFANLKQIICLDKEAEYAFCRFLSATFQQPLVSLSAALALIKERQVAVRSKSSTVIPPITMLSAGFLSDLCDKIRPLHPLFHTKRLIFLLDDFSLPKVPSAAQKTLLPVIWNSGGGYSFRVTAHSESTETVDLRKNSYVVNRDFTEINLGRAYIDSMEVVNFDLIQENKSAVVALETLNWRETFDFLEHLFRENDSNYRFNFLLAPLGSKMQTVGSWAFARRNPSVRVITSTPKTLYPEKYSVGHGQTFIIDDLQKM